ncbi:MAG: hypothetical protein GC185_07050 [Alphaproteobacteria bacterium]|nr:hypothetical protein [Alphaproteobacteria bacterium]
MSAEQHLVFNGVNRPAFSPDLGGAPAFPGLSVSRHAVPLKDAIAGTRDFYYLADNFLDADACQELIARFDETTAEPVGVDGYVVPQDKASIGSYRTNGWAPDLARKLTDGFFAVLKDVAVFEPVAGQDEIFTSAAGPLAIPVPARKLMLSGPTPYMRFMKYFAGGKHAPHYDALYTDEANKYVTLMSWVIYLNTPMGTGGEFQFVEDGQGPLPPGKRDRSDWKRMAEPSEVTAAIAPKEGRLLVFPHWLAHQVQLYQSGCDDDRGRRIIIRGDVAYHWE